jgi:predicted nucleotide-binding protein (sugar kinase/HSP70/actin superfamily)
MLMTTKELAAINLTTARAEMLLNAALRPNGRVGLFGVQNQTVKALSEGGYIARFLAYTPDEIRELEYKRDENIKTAKRALDLDDWHLALQALQQASKLTAQTKEMHTRLTDKGWQFVNDYRKRQDAA